MLADKLTAGEEEGEGRVSLAQMNWVGLQASLFLQLEAAGRAAGASMLEPQARLRRVGGSQLQPELSEPGRSLGLPRVWGQNTQVH